MLKHTLFDAEELSEEFDNFSKVHEDISDYDHSPSSGKSLTQSDR